MSWRVAKSLTKLREQINALAPDRAVGWDGTIGDPAHQSRESDHNAWVTDAGQGVVTALDITHDPQHGVDSAAIAEALRVSRDPRIKYLISMKRIASREKNNFAWRPYKGANPHDHHVRVSVYPEKRLYESTAEWAVGPVVADVTARPVVTRPTLKRGSRGMEVNKLQLLLNIPQDGSFGPATERAVREFQRKNKLTIDGIVGGYTWQKLEASK